jgi:hypothetical protein
VTIASHTELLNRIIAEGGYTSYLEIGVRYADRNFDRIVCDHKDGVDINASCKCNFHMPSDEFWATPGRQYDLIFIDGDHRAFPALRDMVYAIDTRLQPGGTVVVDNINPKTFEYTSMNHCATAWKAWAILRMSRLDLSMVAIDDDNVGWGVMWKGSQELFKTQEDPAGMPCYFGDHWDLTWDYFARFREELLNLVSVETFETSVLPTMFQARQ